MTRLRALPQTKGAGIDYELDAQEPMLTEWPEADQGEFFIEAKVVDGVQLAQFPCAGCGEHIMYVGSDAGAAISRAWNASRRASGGWVALACSRCRKQIAEGMGE